MTSVKLEIKQETLNKHYKYMHIIKIKSIFVIRHIISLNKTAPDAEHNLSLSKCERKAEAN